MPVVTYSRTHLFFEFDVTYRKLQSIILLVVVVEGRAGDPVPL